MQIQTKAAQNFSGRFLALTALQRLVLAGLIAPEPYIKDQCLSIATQHTRTHFTLKVLETSHFVYQDKLKNLSFDRKVSLICTVEYMRNSQKAGRLIDSFIAHAFNARSAVAAAFKKATYRQVFQG